MQLFVKYLVADSLRQQERIELRLQERGRQATNMDAALAS